MYVGALRSASAASPGLPAATRRRPGFLATVRHEIGREETRVGWLFLSPALIQLRVLRIA